MSIHLLPNTTFLFQGDSITDCHRRRFLPHDLGEGYVQMIDEYFTQYYAHLNLTSINRGIAGNRVQDLNNRWSRDCIDLNPQFLSILVGINDTWRRYDCGLIISTETFYRNYDTLLAQFRIKYPDIPILLMSPFLLPVTEAQETWLEDLRPKIETVASLAKKYNTFYIPLQEIFENHLCSTHSSSYWASDGVHPTPEGHRLIANAWLKTLHLNLY